MPSASPRSPLADGWAWLLLYGALALIGGLLALVHPFAASLTVVTFAAMGFVLAGALKMVYARRIRETGAYVVSLALGALFILLGAALWLNPLAGLMSLTALVAVGFVLIGIAKTAFALQLRELRGAGWVLVSGLLTLILGVMIFANFPYAAATVLGLLLGIELISTGVAFVVAALMLRGM